MMNVIEYFLVFVVASAGLCAAALGALLFWGVFFHG